jgi:hypothetical protein
MRRAGGGDESPSSVPTVGAARFEPRQSRSVCGSRKGYASLLPGVSACRCARSRVCVRARVCAPLRPLLPSRSTERAIVCEYVRRAVSLSPTNTTLVGPSSPRRMTIPLNPIYLSFLSFSFLFFFLSLLYRPPPPTPPRRNPSISLSVRPTSFATCSRDSEAVLRRRYDARTSRGCIVTGGRKEGARDCTGRCDAHVEPREPRVREVSGTGVRREHFFVALRVTDRSLFF